MWLDLTVASLVIAAISLTAFLIVEGLKFYRERSGLQIKDVIETSPINESLKSEGVDLNITINGEKVDNFSIFRFRVRNIGFKAIRTKDFESIIHIELLNVKKIYYSKIVETCPKLKPAITLDGDRSLMVAPLLLNPGDTFLIEAWVALENNKHVRIEADARIAGARVIIHEKSHKKKSRQKYQVIGAALALLVIILTLTSSKS